MTAELKDGRISIEPLELNLPGGSFHYSMSVRPDPKKSDAWVRTKIDNFDFGVLVYRVDPTSNMGGTFIWISFTVHSLVMITDHILRIFQPV